MKLIDLDQRVIVPVVDESRGGMRYEMEMSIGELLGKALEDLEPAVVDAVPVGWLKQSRDKLRTMGEYQQGCADAIEFVLRLWRKEQEVRT